MTERIEFADDLYPTADLQQCANQGIQDVHRANDIAMCNPSSDAHRPPAAVRGVIFDMDGTLVDSRLDFDAMRREMGIPVGQPVTVIQDALRDRGRSCSGTNPSMALSVRTEHVIRRE